jgi:hypothetical protein
MEAFPVQALAAGLPLDLAAVPWSFVMAFASLALILFLYRKRPDLFADMDFSGREIALLCLGSMAGWAANFPLAIYGGTYLAVNIGGTLVPLVLVAWWIGKRRLRLGATLVGTALVAVTAWRIVEFHPEAGIVARYPAFFLPVAVALAWGILAGIRRPLTGAPVSYASGTLGALIGADLLHILEIRQHFQAASEKTIISIGGAGVFDMVFLAGTFALALHLGILALVRPRRVLVPQGGSAYPATPLTLRDSRRVHETFRALQKPNGLERSLAGLALSNLALRHGDYAKSVRMSWLAVDSLLQAGPVQAHLAAGGPPGLRGDVALLHERCQAARQGVASLKDAGEANTAAKVLVSALAPHAGMRHALEGVA